MKKIFTAFILLLFVFNIIGYYVPYYIARSYLRSEMNERTESEMNTKCLIKISLSKINTAESFSWTREGKEFSYEGEMYDIVKTEQSGDKIIYYCLRDTGERDLNSIFNTLVKNEHSGDKNDKANFAQELSKYNIASEPSILPAGRPVLRILNIPTFYLSHNGEVNLPPPKLA